MSDKKELIDQKSEVVYSQSIKSQADVLKADDAERKGRLNFKATAAEFKMAEAISSRLQTLGALHGFFAVDTVESTMDVIVTHMNGCPLDLQELLNSDATVFLRDMAIIRGQIDRATGQLKGIERPRCAFPNWP